MTEPRQIRTLATLAANDTPAAAELARAGEAA